MREFEIKEELEKILLKLYNKNRKLHEQVMRKIDEIVKSDNIEHYKNLKYDMKDSKRVHIGHFVLVFSYDKKSDFVSFEDFQHHDFIYRKS